MSLCRTLGGGAREMCEGRYTRAKFTSPQRGYRTARCSGGRTPGRFATGGRLPGGQRGVRDPALPSYLAAGAPNGLGLRPLRRYCHAAPRLPLLAVLSADRVVER
jgi:hypothetical protein